MTYNKIHDQFLTKKCMMYCSRFDFFTWQYNSIENSSNYETYFDAKLIYPNSKKVNERFNQLRYI